MRSLARCVVLALILIACRHGTGTGRRGGALLSPTSAPLSLSTMTANIPGLEAGQGLIWTGSAWAIGPITSDPAYRWTFLEEFTQATCSLVAPSIAFSGGNVGAGTTVQCTNALDGHPGVLSITSGTGVGDGHRALTNQWVTFGTVPHCIRFLDRINNLSTSADWYLDRFGFVEPTSSAESVDGVEATYRPSINGYFWALSSMQNNGGGTNISTKVCNGTGGTQSAPVTANTWYQLDICVNGPGTSAALSVNNVICATNTTNIPTGIARSTGIGWQHFNDSGSVPIAQLNQIDYIWGTAPFGPAR